MLITMNALIVSSDPILVRNIHTFGKDFFSEIDVVPTAEDALEIHEIGRFDVIYINLSLPGMNGLELIKNIKNYDKKQQFIVIFDEEDEKQLFNILRHDISSFILKPVSLEKFIRVTNQTKLLMLDCASCDSMHRLQSEVNNISHENDLQSNLYNEPFFQDQ
jgi:DNA-binding NtrC family response regulator